MQPFDYFKPKEFAEAFQILNTPGKKYVPFAGGTDFIPMYRDGAWKVDGAVDIKGLPEIRDIKETPLGLQIGACVRMSELANSDLVKSHWGILAEAAATVGSEQIRNRATLGGNIATASPCADTPPALFVLEAIVLIRSAEGLRQAPIAEFFTWVRKTVLKSGEMVVGVLLPKPADGSAGAYVKLSRRKGSDLSLVSVAAFTSPTATGNCWRLSLGAVAPTIFRVPSAELILGEGTDDEHIEAAAKVAAESSRPITDVRASETYRKVMVANMTRRAIRQTLASKHQGG
jgi:CO/xanthine dehydrogenase FAD-binding subunit